MIFLCWGMIGMLLELKVKNLAIIESIELQFDAGLNVLTGETGAGKSILLTALNLVLGGRSDRTLVRNGQKEAWAEALFEMTDELIPILSEWGIEADRDEPLALRRIVQNNGRSRAYINCINVPAHLLRQLSNYLIDFGRQHEQSILMNAEHHLDLLDHYAQVEDERKGVEEAYQTVASLLKEKTTLEENQQFRLEREEFLKFQYKTIKEIAPEKNEDEFLSQQLKQLYEQEKQYKLAQLSESLLFTGDDSIQDKLVSVLSPLEELVELAPKLTPLYNDLQNTLFLVEESARTLQSYGRQLHLDPMQIRDLQERLDQLLKLQDKYGGSLDSVLNRQEEIQNELQELNKQKKRYATLDKKIEKAWNKLQEKTEPLSKKRRNIAKKLATQVEKELNDLAMKGARFFVQFQQLKAPDGLANPTLSYNLSKKTQQTLDMNLSKEEEKQISPIKTYHDRLASWGAEKAHFYLAANEGESPYPLEKVASGGELSRILLALKRVLANSSSIQSFVFDEIDAGVAGSAATMVAKKLKQITTEQEKNAQIICISHTPQIAAEADVHFHIKKQTINGRTQSDVVRLSSEEQISEIARMLAGDHSMNSAIELAKALILPEYIALAS